MVKTSASSSRRMVASRSAASSTPTPQKPPGTDAFEPGVVVAQEDDPLDAQGHGRGLGLTGPALAQVVVAEERTIGLAGLAVGRDDEHHTVAFGGGFGHDSGREQSLVVGVRVEGHEGRHGTRLPHLRGTLAPRCALAS